MSKEQNSKAKESMLFDDVFQQGKSREVISILLIGVALLFAGILWAPGIFGGAIGQLLSTTCFGLFGVFSYILPILFLYFAAEQYLTKSSQASSSRKIYILCFLYFVLVLISLLTLSVDKIKDLSWQAGKYSAWKGVQALWESGKIPKLVALSNFWSGGLLGGISALALMRVLGKAGSLIIIIAMIFALAILTFNISWKRTLEKTAVGVSKTGHKVKELGRGFLKKRKAIMEKNKLDYAHRRDEFTEEEDASLAGRIEEKEEVLESEKEFSFTFPAGNWLRNDFDEPLFPEEAPVIGNRNSSPLPGEYFSEEAPLQDFAAPIIRSAHIPLREAYLPAEEEEVDHSFVPNEIDEDIIDIASRIKEGEDRLREIAGREHWEDRSDSAGGGRTKTKNKIRAKRTGSDILGKYLPPPTDLLIPDNLDDEKNNKDEIRLLGAKLEKTLNDFGVDAEVVNFITGPTISRFEVKPGPGVKVSKIVGLSDDIALALAATAVRIEAPIPGKSAIGIEIPNKDTQAVRLRDIIESKEFKESKTKITAALGRNIQGDPILCDISSMPHLLIAGATGSGKSVCINSILISLLYKSSPKDLRMVMIDPKVVELSVYNGIPHLASPVITDPKKAYAVLEWAVKEMEDRYRLFADNAVRDFKAYNELVAQDLIDDGEHLPYILLVIDELSDLMATTPTEVEDAIARLTSMARAAGIHLIIATQRPSVDVITGVIKANIPSRISFAVASQIDSRTILDMGGAEKLLGKGDMLYYPQNASKPLRGQGAFVTDAEVERVVKYLTNHYSAHFNEDLEQELKMAGSRSGSSASGSLASADNEEDELLYEALQVLVDNEYASVSLLQRRLNVGYPRAARMIDAMHEKGWIGPFEGSKPRKLLITAEEAEEIISKG